MKNVTLTQSAANHVNNMLKKRKKGIGLRVSTKKNGCTGFAYVVDYADEIKENDFSFESHGVNIIVDDKSIHHIQGMEIDFKKLNLLDEGFEFNNPNVKDMCGCGESFSV